MFDGTPGPGRPKGSRNGASVAKEWAEKDGGWELIIRMVKGEEPGFMRSTSVRADLAMYLIDRAFGKASQSVELSGPNGGPVDIRGLLLDLCANPQQLSDAEKDKKKSITSDIIDLTAIEPYTEQDRLDDADFLQ